MMEQHDKLTGIERELVLQYLIDGNVPVTLTPVEEPISADKKGTAQLINAAEIKSFECYRDPEMVQNVSSEHKPEESFIPVIEEELRVLQL